MGVLEVMEKEESTYKLFEAVLGVVDIGEIAASNSYLYRNALNV
jgi:hypothetical protein